MTYNINPSIAFKFSEHASIGMGLSAMYADGELKVERGAGSYVDRPPYAPFYDAVKKQRQANEPVAVRR